MRVGDFGRSLKKDFNLLRLLQSLGPGTFTLLAASLDGAGANAYCALCAL